MTKHRTSTAHGVSMRTDGKVRTWAKAVCVCGWHGVEFGSDKEGGWMDVMQASVQKCAVDDAARHDGARHAAA